LTSEVSIKDSEMLYKEHINSIGAFMSEYFGFVLVGGKTKYFYLLSNIAIGIVLDLLISFILQKFLLIFSIFFLLYSIIRIVIKQKNKKIYGPNY